MGYQWRDGYCLLIHCNFQLRSQLSGDQTRTGHLVERTIVCAYNWKNCRWASRVGLHNLPDCVMLRLSTLDLGCSSYWNAKLENNFISQMLRRSTLLSLKIICVFLQMYVSGWETIAPFLCHDYGVACLNVSSVMCTRLWANHRRNGAPPEVLLFYKLTRVSKSCALIKHQSYWLLDFSRRAIKWSLIQCYSNTLYFAPY